MWPYCSWTRTSITGSNIVSLQFTVTYVIAYPYSRRLNIAVVSLDRVDCYSNLKLVFRVICLCQKTQCIFLEKSYSSWSKSEQVFKLWLSNTRKTFTFTITQFNYKVSIQHFQYISYWILYVFHSIVNCFESTNRILLIQFCKTYYRQQQLQATV